MNTKYFRQGWAVLLLFAVIFAGCSKDPDPGTEEFETITFDAEEVLDKLPEGLISSDDTYAQQALAAVESALDMSSFLDDMTPPDYAERTSKKASGSSWSWTVSDGTTTYKFYWEYEEDNAKKYWTMDIQINGGAKYNYIYAWETKDGKQGEVQYNFNWVYAGEEMTEEYEDLYWRYSWNIDAGGNYTFYYEVDSTEPEYEYSLRYEVIVNSDGSGSVEYLLTGEPFYRMEWDAMGNGSWAYYSEGSEIMSGSWTV
jgi:hypothetical protein